MTQALGAEYAPDEQLPGLPATAMLQQIGDADWMLSLTDSLESPTLNLMLSLPNEALARHYAGRWPQVREVLARDILAALRL